MNKALKSQNGITLIALVITVIVLLILASIGIGELSGNKNSIKNTHNTIALTELNKIQQVVIETYIKYMQLGNKNVLAGTPITYAEAETEFRELGLDSTQNLKSSYSSIESVNPELCYYRLNKQDLIQIGLENINNNDNYIVNYYTGEVFNITQKRTANNEALYVYARN